MAGVGPLPYCAGTRPTRPPDEPRWLTDTEMQSWRALGLVVALLPQRLDRYLREQSGINHTYYAVLATLSAQPERRMAMTDLAQMAFSSPSRLSHAVAALEGRGWVTRVPSETDRRVQFAQLTAEGLTEIETAAPGYVAEVRRLVFDNLTATDVADLTRVASKIARMIED